VAGTTTAVRWARTDEGITLMELLPPVGWADVATKHDLLALEGRVDSRFESFEGRMNARFESLEGRMDARFEGLEAKFETLEYKLSSELHRELSSLTWKLFAIYGASMGAMIGALVAVTKL
jgi:hypothetical protein